MKKSVLFFPQINWYDYVSGSTNSHDYRVGVINMNNSKENILEFGEVFTSEKEVNKMLNLVSEETCRIDSRFLEPACGDGNFLIEVLNWKLSVVKEIYYKLYNHKLPIKYNFENDSNDDFNYDISLLKKTGFELVNNLEQTIEDTFNFYSKNINLYQYLWKLNWLV